MKNNDTYSMIGAMINQGFEVEFQKEREKIAEDFYGN